METKFLTTMPDFARTGPTVHPRRSSCRPVRLRHPRHGPPDPRCWKTAPGFLRTHRSPRLSLVSTIWTLPPCRESSWSARMTGSRLRHSYADMVQRSSRFTGAAPLCDRIPIVIMSLTYKNFRRVYLVCILFIYKEHIKQIHHLKSVLYSFDHLNREPLQAFAYTCVFH